ncbi:MAG: hypothetical protein JJT76_11520 [Clostridiaceae bacterium]|nr:hypothetical protein [Clostridiaceae bacterium]
MVTTIGWMNVILIVMMGFIYPLKTIYLKKIKTEGKEAAKAYGSIYKIMRRVHPALGVVIILIGIFHGVQAYTLFTLHTGTILLYTLVVMAIVAIVGPKTKSFKKHWRVIHRVLGIVVFVLMIVHVYWRNII